MDASVNNRSVIAKATSNECVKSCDVDTGSFWPASANGGAYDSSM
jgi:hypothetical protein